MYRQSLTPLRIKSHTIHNTNLSKPLNLYNHISTFYNSVHPTTSFRILCGLISIVIMCNILIWIEVSTLVPFFISALLVVIFISHREWYQKLKNNSLIFLIVITVLLGIQMLFLDGLGSMVSNNISYVIGIFIYCLKDNYKEYMLLKITKIFGYILTASIICYFIFLIHPFPPFMMLDHPYGYLNHQCYIFFILPTYYIIPRFSGPFIEPGHIAMFSCFILYANQFRFRKNKLLYSYLITVFLSFSLAGYILLLISFMFHKRIKLKTIMIFLSILLFSLVFVTKIWNDGNNPINDLIVLRLKFDDKRGIAGNNRNMYDTDNYFNKTVSSGKILYGIGLREFMELNKLKIIGGAGYKIFMIQYGVFGTFLVLCYYFVIAYNFKYNTYSLLFLCLLIVCFIQRAYPYWLAWLVPYISSFNKFNIVNRNSL